MSDFCYPPRTVVVPCEPQISELRNPVTIKNFQAIEEIEASNLDADTQKLADRLNAISAVANKLEKQTGTLRKGDALRNNFGLENPNSWDGLRKEVSEINKLLNSKSKDDVERGKARLKSFYRSYPKHGPTAD